MNCNLCGCTIFVDMNARKGVRCRDCGSLERTRLLWMYLERLQLPADCKILHLAPERGIFDNLSKRFPHGDYTAADIDPKRYSFAKKCLKIDLTELESWPSNEYDLILHCHVMEHIPCNIAYPIFHLHRMMKPTGTHLCVIPFMRGEYEECFDEIGDDERTKRFGQYDHVRRFGREGVEKHLGKVLRMPLDFDATKSFSEKSLVEANIPKSSWRGLSPNSVMQFRKDDYRLVA